MTHLFSLMPPFVYERLQCMPWLAIAAHLSSANAFLYSNDKSFSGLKLDPPILCPHKSDLMTL